MKPISVHADWETRSAVNIKAAGADVYAEDPSTDILTLSYAIGEQPVRRWRPGLPLPQDLFDALDAGGVLVAHNAYFELVIWNHVAVKRYGFPPLPVERVRDTMAIAYAHGLPGALAAVARAVNLPIRKDEEGRRIMLKLSQPRVRHPDGSVEWYERADYPEMFAKLDAYCDTDVEVERALEKRLPGLMPIEQALWELDFKINQRGVPIDLANARRALDIIEYEARQLNAELRRITGGVVPAATNVKKFVAWLAQVKGLEVHSLTKSDVRGLEALPDLPADVRRALEIRSLVGKASTKKLAAMLAATSRDGRARGLHQFHSASTGRWGGRRIQTQNMPRPEKGIDVKGCLEIISTLPTDAAYDALVILYGGAARAISSCLRALIATTEGRRFLTMDFSNVEGRVLPFLAGEHWKLDAFSAIDRGDGKDIYLVAASGIFGENIDDKEDPRRQVGKVSELALGYQGGPGAFANMAAAYALDVESIFPFVWPGATWERKKDALRSWWERGRHANVMSRKAWVAAELVKFPWRGKHPRVVEFWRAIEDAAIAAVEEPGRITRVGQHIRFRKAGSFLFMRLPSGRCLAYPFPKLVFRAMPWKDKTTGKRARKLVLTYFASIDASKKAKIVADPANSGKWARVATYGGELTENAVQAASRDLLRDALIRLEEHGYEPCMHVHDEAVADLPDGVGSKDEMKTLMAVCPAWAAGLPMAADGWEGTRYRK